MKNASALKLKTLLTWNHNTKRQFRLQKEAVRLQNSKLTNAFADWNECVWNIGRKRKALSRVMTRLQSRDVIQVFMRWRDQTVAKKQMQTSSSKAVHCLNASKLWHSFWLSHLFETHQHTAEGLKAAWRHMKSLLATGIKAWAQCTTAQYHAQQKHIEWRAHLELSRKIQVASTANTFAHWMNKKMNKSRLREETTKLLKVCTHTHTTYVCTRTHKHLCISLHLLAAPSPYYIHRYRKKIYILE